VNWRPRLMAHWAAGRTGLSVLEQETLTDQYTKTVRSMTAAEALGLNVEFEGQAAQQVEDESLVPAGSRMALQAVISSS